MEQTKGEIIYFAIDKLIGHQGYQEWQEYYEISDKELNTFLEAGAKAVDELKEKIELMEG